VKLWDVAGRAEIATLKGHTNVVLGVNFSPDGKTLASGSLNTVKLWNVEYYTWDLDNLLVRMCQWLLPYLKNPNAKLSEEERCLCDDILASEPQITTD